MTLLFWVKAFTIITGISVISAMIRVIQTAQGRSHFFTACPYCHEEFHTSKAWDPTEDEIKIHNQKQDERAQKQAAETIAEKGRIYATDSR